MYGDIEYLHETVRKRNDEKSYELCNRICLIIGWSIVICLFIFAIMLYFK
jgi:hypothetical protein